MEGIEHIHISSGRECKLWMENYSIACTQLWIIHCIAQEIIRLETSKTIIIAVVGICVTIYNSHRGGGGGGGCDDDGGDGGWFVILLGVFVWCNQFLFHQSYNKKS